MVNKKVRQESSARPNGVKPARETGSTRWARRCGSVALKATAKETRGKGLTEYHAKQTF